MARRRCQPISGSEKSHFMDFAGRDEWYFDTQRLGSSIDDAFAAAGAPLQMHVGARDLLESAAVGTATFIPLDSNKTQTFVFRGGEMLLRRMDERTCRIVECAAGWDQNLEMQVSLDGSWNTRNAMGLLRLLISLLKFYYGQMNPLAITQKFVFGNLNSHFSEGPGIGYLNYFGAEYLRYFGGLERLQQAGFDSVEEFSDGVLLGLESCTNRPELDERRKHVRAALGEQLFKPRD